LAKVHSFPATRKTSRGVHYVLKNFMLDMGTAWCRVTCTIVCIAGCRKAGRSDAPLPEQSGHLPLTRKATMHLLHFQQEGSERRELAGTIIPYLPFLSGSKTYSRLTESCVATKNEKNVRRQCSPVSQILSRPKS